VWLLKLMISKTSTFRPALTVAVFNGRNVGHLPSLIGLRIPQLTPEGLENRLECAKNSR